MLCQVCQQRAAKIHLSTGLPVDNPDEDPVTMQEQHFCKQCADAYFASIPGMNSMRSLICLSDSYRSKLYDLLEASHPQALDNTDSEACLRASEIMRVFLREHLKKNNIEINEDAFGMLCHDFFGSHHFYTRSDEYKRKKRD
jgi:protein-arginine kinase activator protein McsA